MSKQPLLSDGVFLISIVFGALLGISNPEVGPEVDEGRKVGTRFKLSLRTGVQPGLLL